MSQLPPPEPPPPEQALPEPPPPEPSGPEPSAPGPLPVRPARRLSPLTPLLKAPILLVAVLGGAWNRMLESDRTGIGLFLLLVLLVGLGIGFATWLRTTYWIDERELRVDTGLLSRQSRRIRIDRLQGVDIHQPFIARIFGHAQLRFDVAGGDTEGDLAFLPLAEADEVRTLLLLRRNLLRAGAEQPGTGSATTAAGEERGDREQPLAHLELRLLAVSTLLTIESLVFLLGAGVTGVAAVSSGSLATAGFLIPVVLGTGLALGRQVNANYGHVVSQSDAGLVLRRGLLGISRQTVALPRVQGVRITQPLLWRRFGWARLEVSVAGSGGGGEESGRSSVLMPVADLATIRGLAVRALRGLDPYDVPLVPAPPRARWRAPLSAPWAALGSTGQMVVSRRGLVTRRLDAVPTTRVQSLGMERGPWSRALGLADLQVHSPVGRVNVLGRFREEGEARTVLQRLVEDSRRARSAALGRDAPRSAQDDRPGAV